MNNPSHLFLLLLGLAGLPTISASAQNLVWARQLGGTMNDFGGSITVDQAGSVLTAGSFFGTADFDPGTGTFSMTSAGSLDLYISKLDSSGNFVWAKRIGGTGNEQSPSLALDSSGNIYCSGAFSSTVDFDPGPGTFNLTSVSGLDMFVLKVNNSGTFMWAKQISGTSTQSPNAVTLDSAGNIITVGSFFGAGDFDPGAGTFSMSPVGLLDVFVSKLDNSGNFVWAKRLGGTNQDEGYTVAVDRSGNVFASGYFSGTADFDPGTGTFNLTSNGGSQDIFISKLSAAGAFMWAVRLGNSFNEDGRSLATDTGGHVYATGQFTGTVDFDPGPGTFNLVGSGSDAYVVKLDSLGNLVWAKRLGGTSGDFGYGLGIDVSGNIITTGYFNGTADFDPGNDTFNLTTAGVADIFVCKLDAAGNFIRAKAMGGSATDQGTALTTGERGIYVTGYFNQTADFNPDAGTSNLTSFGGQDAFVVRLQCFPTASTISVTACDSYLSPSGRHVWTVSGSFNDTLRNLEGCDSIVTVNLTIRNSTSSVINPVVCYVYTSPSSNHTWMTSGAYMDTVTNNAGCDSVITINLTINQSSSALIAPTACFTYTSPSGTHTWNASGTYVDTLINMHGCDSFLTISLTVNTVDVSVTQSSDILASNANGATYRWLDCDDGFAEVSGATGKIFTTTLGGIYAVEVTQSGCVDTSGCYAILGVGMETVADPRLYIYPNPASGKFTLDLGREYHDIAIEVSNVLGETVEHLQFRNSSLIHLDADWRRGMYYLTVRLDDGNPGLLKVIKE